MRVWPILLLPFVALACSDDPLDDAGPSDGGLPDGGADLGTDAGDIGGADAGDVGTSSCSVLRVENLGFDFLDDVSIRYGGDLEPELGRAGPDYFIFDTLRRLDFPTSTGAFALGGSGFNGNFATCTHCPLVFEDFVSGGAPERIYFPRAGQVELEEDPFSTKLYARFTGLKMVEVTIEGEFLESVPVPNGRCLEISDFEVRYRYVPDEWTCDDAQWNDGLACDCGCGTEDWDCYPEIPTITGCQGDQVCLADACVDRCSAFAPLEGCAGGFCSFNYWGDLCSTEFTQIDPADLGQVCGGVDTTYCDVQGGIPRGLCDRFIRADNVCKPTCRTDDDCSAANRESCNTIAPERGFCEQRFPEGWTCGREQWEEGQFCDCNCGVADTIDCQSELPVRGCAAEEGCSLEGACVPRPANDTCAGAVLLSGTNTSTSGTTVGATDDLAVGPGQGLCLEGSQEGRDVVYRLELQAGEVVQASLQSEFDGALYLLGPGSSACTQPSQACVAGQDQVRAGEVEVLDFTAATAGTYFLVVDSFWNPEQGRFQLTVERR